MKTKLLLFFVILTNSLFANFVSDGIRYSIRSDSSVYVTYENYQNPNNNYKNINKTIRIPEFVEYNDKNYQVTGIGDYAFYYTSLDSVYFPNSIKEVGCWAFAKSFIKFIHLGDSCKNIGEKAFSPAQNIEIIEIPASLRFIGTNAFEFPSKLKDIYCFGEVPPTLQYYCFYMYGDMKSKLNKINLHVPEGCSESYKQAGDWKYFNIIEETTVPTNITNVELKKHKNNIILLNGCVLIEINGQKYNIIGQKVQ